jgi:lantibiotic modifying enzyme
MKSKFVFLLVLFSLFVNISHDFLLASEVDESCTSMVQMDNFQYLESCCVDNMVDLHEIFHYSAILSNPKVPDSLHSLYNELHFTTLISLTSIYENSFRPPIG